MLLAWHLQLTALASNDDMSMQIHPTQQLNSTVVHITNQFSMIITSPLQPLQSSRLMQGIDHASKAYCANGISPPHPQHTIESKDVCSCTAACFSLREHPSGRGKSICFRELEL